MSKLLRLWVLFLTFVCLVGNAQSAREPEHVRASFYAPQFEGNLMANGRRYHGNVISAASLSFPIGTEVRVTNAITGKSVLMTITDRGPWRKRFRIDLSKAAFTELGFDQKAGWGWVTVERAR